MNIAALISGGVDSAVVVHLLCKQGYKPDLFYIKIVMVVYSIGALILAFKNEDPDSKTKNTSMMVISIILIFLETFVNASGILDKLA